jgi:hypothetical protein
MPAWRTGAQWLGCPQMYHMAEGTLDFQLAVSRDGRAWRRVADRAVWLPLGKAGAWDRFNQSLASAPVPVGDELWFYYGGRTYLHSWHRRHSADRGPRWGAVGLARLRRDGFVSLAADFTPGVLLTTPFILGGEALHLNAAARFGELRVEVLPAAAVTANAWGLDDTPPLAIADPTRADGVDIPVLWNGTPRLPATVRQQPVRLRFTLRNAELYAWWCDEAGP